MTRLYRPSAFLFATLIFASTAAWGQVPKGLPPFGSFSGGPDVINDANLNAHLAIPVVSKGGRGMGFNYTVTYDSSVWSPRSSSGQAVWTPLSNWGWGGVTQQAIGYVTYNSNTYTGTCWWNGTQ